MYIDFTKGLESPTPFGGWLEKKGSLRKNWKLRYFYLADGLLKYYGKGPSTLLTAKGEFYEGSDIKGDVSLLGAEVSIFEGTQLHLTLHEEKKSIFYLRAKTNQEATEWQKRIAMQIHYKNSSALQNGSRAPEIVEWYYQYQTEIYRKNLFLQKSIEVYLHFRVSEANSTVSVFNIAMNNDKTGLVLSILSGARKNHRLESINNGRIILFSDIIGANLPEQGWTLSSENRFLFTLVTSEDELSMEMDAMGVPWLYGVQEMIIWSKIPKPSARSISISPAGRVASSNMNSLIEFSSSSGAVFTCSNDVQLILEGFNRVTSKSPAIGEISFRLNSILKLIPDLKYNKESGFIFGERIEEIIRILGDSENGILYISRENDKALVNFHLSTLNNKLNDIIQYLVIQCKKGWLTYNMNAKTQDLMRSKFEQFDYELISIVNILVKALGMNSSLLMEKKDYSMTVDLKKSIDALGGIEAVSHDVAKERALARLIQAEGHEIHNEVIEFIKLNQSTEDPSNIQSNYRASVNAGRRRTTPVWSYLFCCCLKNKDAVENTELDKYQLYDDKNIISIDSTTNPVHYHSHRISRRSLNRPSSTQK